MAETQNKRRPGCLFYSAILAVVILLGGYLGLLVAKRFINQLTDPAPAQLPTAQLPETQMFQLHDRMETFSEAVRDGETTPPLEISADELNALIATDANLAQL